jgi:thymidylate kinase
MFARFIAIEGPDKVGKTTQATKLVSSLGPTGAVKVKVPFNDGITHRLIYWMLKNGTAMSCPNIFQTIQFLNKFLCQAFLMPWCWLMNDFVVVDRWMASFIVYGKAGGANELWTSFLSLFLVRPYHTVVMMGPCYASRNERKDDVYESDDVMQKCVRDGYVSLLHGKHDCSFVMTGCQPDDREGVHGQIVAALRKKDVL